MENSVVPDQIATTEASWFLFKKKDNSGSFGQAFRVMGNKWCLNSVSEVVATWFYIGFIHKTILVLSIKQQNKIKESNRRKNVSIEWT